MTPPSEKLAGSLNALLSLQERGVVAVRAADLARSHRERLVRHEFLLGRSMKNHTSYEYYHG